MSEFDRGLKADGFIRQLAGEAKKGQEPKTVSWWADVLSDPELFVAVRDDYLNVYWRGHSLFRVEQGASAPRATTHPKFLLDPEVGEQVPLEEGEFKVGWLADHGFISNYEGRETLEKMKKAADLFSQPEKTGCHEIILSNPQVIDCEIALPGYGGPNKGAPRVDLLTLEPDGDDVRLVFWEAKHFSNDDLRAQEEEDVQVCKQIAHYRQCLSEQRNDVEKSYKLVVKNLVAFEEMGWKRGLSPLIREVADDRRKLTLGAEPKVGLVIFGFDKAQRDDPNWRDHHLARLKRKVAPAVAAGDAKNIQLRL
jgi:hypothetical protein